MNFDLHSHTTNSDGRISPDAMSEILKPNLIWTVTDHNDIRYHTKHKAPLTGTELTADVLIDGRVQAIEVLAYGFDVVKLNNAVAILKEYSLGWQKVNLGKLIERVKGLGCKLDDTIGLNESGFAHATLYEELIKYEENAKILGSLMSSAVAFYHDGQSEGSPIYINIPSSPFTLQATHDLVKRAGGRLILAHPYYYKSIEVVELLWSVRGLVDGIECLHPSAGITGSRSLIDYCRDNKLLASGGSDYHKGLYAGTPNMELSTLGDKDSPFNWLLDYISD